ncbi:MAG: hypothetical protein Q7U75_11085, partial [Desulfobacterales bacterium]|nr:hypothetical protein [Desulfobacterales bacterium]
TAQDYVEQLCLTVQDFPRPGISFRDLTPVFSDGPAFRAVIDDLVKPFTGTFDLVAGIEARGFLLAAAVAREEGLAQIVHRGGQAADHPALLSMPETAYLKCVGLLKMKPA